MDLLSALFAVDPFLARTILAMLDLDDLSNVRQVSENWERIFYSLPEEIRNRVRERERFVTMRNEFNNAFRNPTHYG